MKKQAIALLLGGAILIQPILPMLSVQAEEKVEINKEEKNEGYKEEIVEKRILILNLDKEMLILKQELEKLTNEAKKKGKDLSKKNVELQEREAHLELLWTQHSERIAILQTKGLPEHSFIDFILSSESISDVIGKTYAYNTLLKADNEKMEHMKKESIALKAEKEKLEKDLETLEAQNKEVVKKETLLKDKNKKMKKELSQLESKEVKRLQAEIVKQEKRKKELLEKQLVRQSSNSKSDVEQLLVLTSEMGENVEYETTFMRPTDGRLSSPFQVRSNPFGGGQIESHQGLDFASPAGTPIRATADGVVIKALSSNTGYGKYVTVQHNINNKTFYSVYAHMSVIGVEAGEKVSQGEVVGLVGSTGRSTGPHLHFEIQDENKVAKNPAFYLGTKVEANEAKVVKEDKQSKEKE